MEKRSNDQSEGKNGKEKKDVRWSKNIKDLKKRKEIRQMGELQGGLHQIDA